MTKEQIDTTVVDGFIQWKGDECPVDDNAQIEIICVNGDRGIFAAVDIDWRRLGQDTDVIEYRVLSK